VTAATMTREPAARSHLAEIRRLRGQLAAALAARHQLAAMLAELLAMSAPDPRDAQLRQLEHAGTWAAGYAEGEAAGFARAVAEYKRAQLDAVDDLELYLARWGGPRERFGDPLPGDRGPVAPADIAAIRQRWDTPAGEVAR
jgi:hypothetical protein